MSVSPKPERQVIRWEDPPPPAWGAGGGASNNGPGRSRFCPVVRALDDQPGRWALFLDGTDVTAAKLEADALRMMLRANRREADFEIATRRGQVFARRRPIGEPSPTL